MLCSAERLPDLATGGPGCHPGRRIPQPMRSKLAALTTVDDVVDLEDFGLARIDAELAQDRRKTCPECVQLLLGVPNLADLKVAVRAEAELIIEAFCGKDALLGKATYSFVVLLRRQRVAKNG